MLESKLAFATLYFRRLKSEMPPRPNNESLVFDAFVTISVRMRRSQMSVNYSVLAVFKGSNNQNNDEGIGLTSGNDLIV